MILWKSALVALIHGMSIDVGFAVRVWRYLRALTVWREDAAVSYGSLKMIVERVILVSHS